MLFRSRNRPETDRTSEIRAVDARGGVSIAAVLTGVLVAFGAMFLLSALIGGILAATGVETTVESATQEATLGAGIALVAAMFLAYLWGGYTAGRMGRGAGAINGLLVPVLALIVAGIVLGVVAALGATANLNLPFGDNRLPIEGGDLVEFGAGIGVASLIAMFVGAILGGITGARWHTRLERHAVDVHKQEHLAEERDRAEQRRLEEQRVADERVAESRRRAAERRESHDALREQSPPPPQDPAPVDLREEDASRNRKV